MSSRQVTAIYFVKTGGTRRERHRHTRHQGAKSTVTPTGTTFLVVKPHLMSSRTPSRSASRGSSPLRRGRRYIATLVAEAKGHEDFVAFLTYMRNKPNPADEDWEFGAGEDPLADAEEWERFLERSRAETDEGKPKFAARVNECHHAVEVPGEGTDFHEEPVRKTYETEVQSKQENHREDGSLRRENGSEMTLWKQDEQEDIASQECKRVLEKAVVGEADPVTQEEPGVQTDVESDNDLTRAEVEDGEDGMADEPTEEKETKKETDGVDSTRVEEDSEDRMAEEPTEKKETKGEMDAVTDVPAPVLQALEQVKETEGVEIEAVPLVGSMVGAYLFVSSQGYLRPGEDFLALSEIFFKHTKSICTVVMFAHGMFNEFGEQLGGVEEPMILVHVDDCVGAAWVTRSWLAVRAVVIDPGESDETHVKRRKREGKQRVIDVTQAVLSGDLTCTMDRNLDEKLLDERDKAHARAEEQEVMESTTKDKPVMKQTVEADKESQRTTPRKSPRGVARIDYSYSANDGRRSDIAVSPAALRKIEKKKKKPATLTQAKSSNKVSMHTARNNWWSANKTQLLAENEDVWKQLMQDPAILSIEKRGRYNKGQFLMKEQFWRAMPTEEQNKWLAADLVDGLASGTPSSTHVEKRPVALPQGGGSIEQRNLPAHGARQLRAHHRATATTACLDSTPGEKRTPTRVQFSPGVESRDIQKLQAALAKQREELEQERRELAKERAKLVSEQAKVVAVELANTKLERQLLAANMSTSNSMKTKGDKDEASTSQKEPKPAKTEVQVDDSPKIEQPIKKKGRDKKRCDDRDAWLAYIKNKQIETHLVPAEVDNDNMAQVSDSMHRMRNLLQAENAIAMRRQLEREQALMARLREDQAEDQVRSDRQWALMMGAAKYP